MQSAADSAPDGRNAAAIALDNGQSPQSLLVFSAGFVIVKPIASHGAGFGDRLGGVSANPFVVQATGVSGLYAADVVLGDFDATRVLVADSDDDFLRECRVIFVLGPKPVSFEEMYGVTTFMDTTLMSEVEELELQGETAPSDQPQ